MNAPSPAELRRLSVATAGRALCVVAVAGTALLAARGIHSSIERNGVWLAATVVTAAVVMVARAPITRLADRAAYGRQGDPYARLSDFARRISETLAVDEVLPRMAQTVTQATHSSSSEVRLTLSGGAELRETWPAMATGKAGGVLEVPVRHHGVRVGTFGVATADGELPSGSRELLDRLAGTAGVALANVRLAYDLRDQLAESQRLAARLEESQRRLLEAAAAENERFSERVGALVLSRLDTAGEALERAEHGDVTGIERAGREAAAALEALRGLAHGVFPPTLTDSGLRVALEALAVSRDGGLRVGYAGSSDRPPPAIETAAYFCTVQLVEDCVSEGATVQVDVDRSGSATRVRLSNDDAPRASTVQRIEDRVEATGGSLQVAVPADDAGSAYTLVMSWS